MFVRHPFSEQAHFDFDAIVRVAGVAVRSLDNVYDLTSYPLPAIRDTATRSRRLGLGITGLADALVMLGLRYDSEPARVQAAKTMQIIRQAAYHASTELAAERGSFPLFAADAFLAGKHAQELPASICDQIRAHGLRNSHLTAIAPCGSISLLADHVSSGIEPIYDWHYTRRLRRNDGTLASQTLTNYAFRQYQRLHGQRPLSDAFVRLQDVDAHAQLQMQAWLQPFVDGAIAKTVQVPTDCSFAIFVDVFETAYRLGLKGCAAFRASSAMPGILATATARRSGCEGGVDCAANAIS